MNTMFLNLGEPCGRLVELTPAGAFPDDRNTPARCAEVVDVPAVPRHICRELALPEVRARSRGCRETAALVTMPEAAMDEHGTAPACQHDVRSPGEMSAVQAVSEACSMKRLAEFYLGTGIPALYASHHARARGAIDYVSHATDFSVCLREHSGLAR